MMRPSLRPGGIAGCSQRADYNARMSLTAGTKLGPYEIVAPLGAGGMGEVYQARDTRLDRTVAIKILPSHLSDDVTRRQRFEREAKAVSSLNHPHICTLYDIGRQDGVDFIVMEYVDGVTLAARLEKGPLPTAEVLEYGIQLARALDKAHRNREGDLSTDCIFRAAPSRLAQRQPYRRQDEKALQLGLWTEAFGH